MREHRDSSTTVHEGPVSLKVPNRLARCHIRLYPEPMTTKTWQITADILFPNQLGFGVEDGRPQVGVGLLPQSRIPTQRRDLDGAIAFIRPGDPKGVPGVEEDPRWSVASITVRIACDVDGQPQPLRPPSLSLTTSSRACRFRCRFTSDSNPRGDRPYRPACGRRQCELARSSGFPRPTFRPTAVPMQSLVGRLVPDLSIDLDPTDQKANRALTGTSRR